jgi:hypothetical protein
MHPVVETNARELGIAVAFRILSHSVPINRLQECCCLNSLPGLLADVIVSVFGLGGV